MLSFTLLFFSGYPTGWHDKGPDPNSMFENQRAKNNIAVCQKMKAEAVDPNMGSIADNRKSLSKLKELRRREFCPDPSYDLNGDGTVSQKELLIASRFDKN